LRRPSGKYAGTRFEPDADGAASVMDSLVECLCVKGVDLFEACSSIDRILMGKVFYESV
jgi:hypothetical protein